MKFHRLFQRQGMHVLSNDIYTWSKLSFLLKKKPQGSFGFRTSWRKFCSLRTNQTGLTKYNPISELQPFISVPIIQEGAIPFNPSEPEIKSASKFFTPKGRSHQIQHIGTAADMSKLPTYDIPEVAFIGRSNVGKSSLIRALFSSASDEVHRKVAVSSKPGRTKALQLYQAGTAFTLVDMPGYGHNMPSYFKDCVETYFKERKKLVRSFILIDAVMGITESDRIGLEMMEEMVIPYVMVFILIDGEIGLTTLDKEMLEKLEIFSTVHCMVLTKIDKTTKHQLLRNLMSVIEYRDQHNKCCLPQPFLVSSHSGAGIELLKTLIAYVTGNMLVKGS